MPVGFQQGARTAPTMVTGYRNIGETVSQRVIADVADKLIFTEPRSAPLCALTQYLRSKRKATQYRVDWLEKDPMPRSLLVSGAQTSGDATIEITGGQEARAAVNYVLLNKRTREQILVTAVNAGSLTVARGIGGGNAAMLDGDELIFLRSVYEDGADIGTLKSAQEFDNYNYCETIRTPYGWTDRQAHTALYGGRDPETERRFHMIEHLKSIEFAELFGKRHSRTGVLGRLQTFMGGLEFYLQSNTYDLNGNEPTLRMFNEWLEYAMQYGPNGKLFGGGTKYFLCSDRWLTYIDEWKEGKLEMRTIDKKLDIEVGELVTSHGRVIIVPEPLFSRDHPDYGMLLDLGALRYVYHDGRDTKVLGDRQGNGEDAYKEEIRTDCCIQVEQEIAHGLIKGGW